MNSETFLLIIGYSLFLVFFALIIKSALTLKRDRNRIIDLLFIGFTLYFTHICTGSSRSEHLNSLFHENAVIADRGGVRIFGGNRM